MSKRTDTHQIHRGVVNHVILKLIKRLRQIDSWESPPHNLYERQILNQFITDDTMMSHMKELKGHLFQLLSRINDTTWKFDISKGIHDNDSLSILKYSGTHGHNFPWHVDDGPQGHEAPEPYTFGDGSTCRKLAFSIGLTDYRTFEGGVIEFDNSVI